MGKHMIEFVNILTSELPVIISSSVLNIETREGALNEFSRRLTCENENFSEYMSGLMIINECSLFHKRAKNLMEMLNDRMKKNKRN